MSRTPPLRLPAKSRRRGIALVVTLAIIVLVTIAVVAFFSRATSNRGVEASRTNQVLAEQLALTAVDYVTGQFLEEIKKPANSNISPGANGITIYQPKAAKDIVPDRTKIPSFASVGSGFENLIRQSTPASDPNASDAPTTGASRNSRTVKATRWDAPRLTAANFGAAQVPNWIYLQRDGSTSAIPQKDGSSNPTIGRFAYNVYNIGGLLDANVVGYPAAVTGISLQDIKSTVAGLDLTKIKAGSQSAGINSSDADTFVAWRNAQSSANYPSSVSARAAKGFLDPTPGDHLITTRQDLINLANPDTGLGLPMTALPYLTHFSRSVNAPSAPAVTASSTVNPFFANTRVTTSFLRRDNTTAKAGEPLLNRRFPLRKLDLLTLTATAAVDSPIEKYFGLTRSNAGAAWAYRGGSISIKTLDQVASEGREPDFFELLKAGITAGSIGKPSVGKTLANAQYQTMEGDKDLQIFRIGACIIDQWDNDNFPTRIATGSATQIGVENLPYLYTTIVADRWRSTAAGPEDPNKRRDYNVDYALIFAPMLFNPHAASTGTPISSGPSQIRIRIANGSIGPISIYNYNSEGDAFPLSLPGPKTLTGLPAIIVPQDDFEKYRLLLQVPRASSPSAPARLNNQIAWWSPTDPYCGFAVHIKTGILSKAKLSDAGSPKGWFPLFTATSIMMVVEYSTADGGWQVYDTMAGSADLPLTGITTSAWTDNWSGGVGNLTSSGQNTLDSGGHFITKWDPRSNRWGPSHGWGIGADHNPTTDPLKEQLVRRTQPFPPLVDMMFGMYPEQAQSTAAPYKVVPGLDGIYRPNDGWRGSGSQRANPFRDTADQTRRPVILQRPFRSVAEMGYAFRDTPWQTLSFFDATSGDANLLDLFSLEDEPPITAGKVNLNAASNAVVTAVFSNTPKAPDGNSASFLSNPSTLAVNLAAFRESSGGALANRSQLPSFLSSPSLTEENSENVKVRREAIVRAVADVADTRTWGLFVDVIAQVGHFPASGGTGSGDFIVDAERRFWSSVAIDRYLGRSVAQQSESVSE